MLENKSSLMDALALLFPKSSKTTLRSWIKEGRVLVDSIPVILPQHQVKVGQAIELSARKKYLPNGLSILYEDRDIIVVDKPAGLLSVASNFQKDLTVHAFLKNYYHPRRVHVVHRLDQDTSGVMLFALNEHALESLKKTFEVHDIERIYIAVVEGHFEKPTGTWRSFLFEDKTYRVHASRDESEGEEAITHYKLLQKSKKFSLLELKLETGKKNQIRVHCQEAGHAVVGDKKYGSRSNPIKRLCLHAHSLAFNHPISKRKMKFESPVPVSFYKL